jgi:hypothetical protein
MDVKILDAWIQQQKDIEDEGDLNLILIKISRKDCWVVYPDNLGFTSKRSILYKGWHFTSWRDFWTTNSNVNLVKHYATLSTIPVEVSLIGMANLA